MPTTDAETVVFRALDRMNEVQPEGNLVAKAHSTVLIGEGGQLDSMAFVNFVAALEEELAATLDVSANYVDELNSRSVDSKAATVGHWIQIVDTLLHSAGGPRND